MDRLIATIILSFFFSVVWSQEPFGTLNTKWTFEGWSEGSGWEPNWQGNCQGNRITFEVTDEIEINGKTCGIIKSNKNNDSLIVYQENDIVYFHEDSTFFKLFDYNSSKGDTIISFRPTNAGKFSLKVFYGVQEFYKPDTIYTLIVDYDTTVINGVELRRWKTEPIYNTPSHEEPVRLYGTIIENIGCLNGLLGDHGVLDQDVTADLFVMNQVNLNSDHTSFHCVISLHQYQK